MTDAQATVEFAIRNGLVQRAHLTGLRPDLIEFAVSDIVESLFSHATVWAVIEHAGTILVRARTVQHLKRRTNGCGQM